MLLSLAFVLAILQTPAAPAPLSPPAECVKAARDLPKTIATTLAAAVPLNDWLRAAPEV